MIPLSDEHVNILRAEPIVRRVEYVKYPGRNEYWVTLREGRRLDMRRLEPIVRKHDYRLVRFGGLPSKLPKGLSELLWNGVTHVILKEMSGSARLTSALGFEPDGIARVLEWGHGPYQIFATHTWEGLKIFFDYLELEMPAPPAPPAPPRPAAAARPATIAQPQAATPAPPAQPQPSRPQAQAATPSARGTTPTPVSESGQATSQQPNAAEPPAQSKAKPVEKKPEPAG